MKNRKTIIYCLIFAWGLMLALAMAGCTPEQKARSSQRKLNRILKKHPELTGTDTVTKTITVVTPGIVDSVAFDTKPDTSAVDSLTQHFAAKVDTVTLDSLNTGFKTILVKATTFDTILKTGRARYHVTEKAGRLKIELETDTTKQDIKVPVAINKVSAKFVPTWYQRLFMWVGKDMLIIIGSFLFLLLALAVYKGIRKAL
jgi:hypothetical protein